MPDSISPATPDAHPRRIPSLDGLRAVSISLVLLGHASGTVPLLAAHDSIHRFLESGARLGVAVFFVISGFIITNLLLRESAATGRIHLARFYARRALRIWPPFYLYLLILAVASALGLNLFHPREWLASALFVWNYADDANWWLGHSWSLAVEEQFYLLWPAALILAGRRKSIGLATILIAVCPLIRIGCYCLFPNQRHQIEFWFHTRMDSLMFGCLLALVAGTNGYQKLAAAFAKVRGPLLATIFVLVISPLLAGSLREIYNVSIRFTLEGAAIALAIDWLVRHPDSAAGRFLNSRWVVHIGLISYSLYLWQQPFLTPENTTPLGRPPLNLICAFLLAEASYWLVERSFNHFRTRLRSAPNPAQA